MQNIRPDVSCCTNETIIFVLLAVCWLSPQVASAQEGDGYYLIAQMFYDSWLSIDPATGATQNGAYTNFYAYDDLGGQVAVSASSGTFSSLGNDTEIDNCGFGCASASAYGQVPDLSTTYTESATHGGNAFDYFSYETLSEEEYTSDSNYVPGLPYASLQSINVAVNGDLTFTYSLSGPAPYSQVMVIGGLPDGVVVFNNGGSSFAYSQNYFSPGATSAQLQVGSYGIFSASDLCNINVTSNSDQGYSGGRLPYDGDGIALTGWPYQFWGTNFVMTYSYCMTPTGISDPTWVSQAGATITLGFLTGIGPPPDMAGVQISELFPGYYVDANQFTEYGGETIGVNDGSNRLLKN